MFPDPDGTWPDMAGTTANNGPQVQAVDMLTQSTESAGQDKWTGWLQNLVGSAASYAIAKDAAKNGLQPARSANGQPVYTGGYVPQPAAYVSAQSVNWPAVLIIGAAVVGAVLLVRK